MPYSLVSAATLGFDLVRLPGGRAAADVLLTGLTAGPDDLAALAAASRTGRADREQRAVLAVRARRARELAAAVPQLRSVTPGAEDRTAVLVAQLERGTIGTAAAVERVLREDVLGPEHAAAAQAGAEVRERAAEVLADAVVGEWAAGVLPPLVRRELVAPFTAAVPDAATRGADADLGPATPGLCSLLATFSGLDARGRERWRGAVDDGRAEQRPWATAMHEASWAAHVSGRTRTLATAQLLAVRAFADGGFDARDGASGSWNALAGVVQGLTMGDLLGGGALDVLLAPWHRVTAR
ncbi:hypothetical protein SAMN04488107_4686 [Geodermatophilus saharensis]|uniref:Uncharacterized protein n=1 Tax=Geodermatophilus saharensis TaxID=1137994 RepID=A0A239J9F6_9ACTN|nr:hypothetical protein [Geodermatophilus saharensis]SNT02419.1 hypothetical protein SAMN04488107_4686 [Geodermatophilus saharensis]